MKEMRQLLPVWIGVLLLLAFLAGCASFPEIERADNLRFRGDKIQALKLYKENLPKLPEDSRIKESVLSAIESLSNDISSDRLAKAEVVYGNSPSIPPVKGAIAILEEALSFDTKEGLVKNRLSHYKNILSEIEALYEKKIADSKALQAKHAWTDAYTLLDEAKVIDPENRSLHGLRESLIFSRDKYYSNKIIRELNDDNWREGQKSLMSYRGEKPAPQADMIRKLDEALLKVKEDVVVTEASALVSKGKYYTAYHILKEASLPSASEYMNEVINNGTDYYRKKAEDMLSKGERSNLGLAYLLLVKATALNSLDTFAFELHRNIRDKINFEIVVQIAISGFGSPNSAPQAGTHLSDSLIAYLVDHFPAGIEILERSRIDLMLKESGLELSELSKRLGVKLFIIGNVNTLDIEQQRSVSEAVVVVPIGKTVVPNPEYNQMLATYGQDKAKWTSKPSPTIVEVKNEMIKYKMGKERIRGLMDVSIRIFDAEKGSITVAKTFNAAETAEDEFRDPVPAANISHDPLTLPTNNEIRENLINKLVSQVADVVLKSFAERERRYWENAKWRIERREISLAINELAKGYHYCLLEGMMGKNNWCAKISEAALFEYTE